METASLELIENPTSDQMDLILHGVRAYNYASRGHSASHPIVILVHGKNGDIIGGVHGDLWERSLHINALWVKDTYRGKGYGSALVRELEAYAATRGCILAFLETLSYQARPFYERQGYTVFGELEGIAENCTYYFMRKQLSE